VAILGCMEDIPLDGAIIRPYVDLNLETLFNVRVAISCQSGPKTKSRLGSLTFSA